MEDPIPAIMIVPDRDPIPKDPFVADMKLLVVPAATDSGESPDQVDAKMITVEPCCRLQDLKRHISKELSAPVIDMTLFFQNQEGPHSQRLTILDDDYSLKHQGVTTGATVVCQLAAWNRPTSKLGESAYYMWAANQKVVPDDIRVQKCGAPVQLQIAESVLVEAAPLPLRSIQRYSWVDDSRRTVKVYISAEGEPAAIAAAGREGDSRLQVDYGEQSLRIKILGDTAAYELVIDELEHRIVPDECKAKLAAGKRISVTLKKAKEDSLWNTLIRRK